MCDRRVRAVLVSATRTVAHVREHCLVHAGLEDQLRAPRRVSVSGTRLYPVGLLPLLYAGDGGGGKVKRTRDVSDSGSGSRHIYMFYVKGYESPLQQVLQCGRPPVSPSCQLYQTTKGLPVRTPQRSGLGTIMQSMILRLRHAQRVAAGRGAGRDGGAEEPQEHGGGGGDVGDPSKLRQPGWIDNHCIKGR